ncbi:MAG: 2-amino-4-hydroxy-6-hydroxymethyldihydropteridine diphosphokinase [Acidimicrobiia bacterium]|nr:2-amino-4-hydroxy-6-hydroxymethyldihydropteridine diphosphokinase [Actinomycetota bacterium]MBL6927294.1 2-amino-4-hydroxy-6-hydroxymethyldihydropteridine diphosphokinase [Acidimicrobiia bacterium]
MTASAGGLTRRALLGLGSNVGDRWAHLRGAVAAMPDVVEVSAVYETAPVGGPDQGPYLNCVVRLDTALSPRALLELCREREVAAGRVRRVRWGPRTLDVDVLWIDGESVNEHDLTVPHPRMFERAFVLVPLRDVAPDLVDVIPGNFSGEEIVPVGPLAEPGGF